MLLKIALSWVRLPANVPLLATAIDPGKIVRSWAGLPSSTRIPGMLPACGRPRIYLLCGYSCNAVLDNASRYKVQSIAIRLVSTLAKPSS
jgi:hypothetical protein